VITAAASRAERYIALGAERPTIWTLLLMRTFNRIWLHPGELQRVALQLKRIAPCDMLVFGVGNDSTYWRKLNDGGRTVFLEDNREWLEHVRRRDSTINAHLVHYSTRRDEWQSLLGSKRALSLQLPPDVAARKWDIILVDGPRSNSDAAPGRMLSIAAASQLAGAGASVFVHDCNRSVERAYCDYYLGPANLHDSGWRLRHYKLNR
jgi:uncharacterized protein (TIGR01627 family)